ncbi:HVA22/TB2/DP1 family protein [Skeletonema marinoi]|uniref:HVA22/TB2/DP1 family protein n=1 Tax=Skeletonema marinoi TaxID=267567 RepID=A0AAD9DK58_9STRA|nr:HVA22/TB2/DP1 family protein [Skeletonema marinoi]
MRAIEASPDVSVSSEFGSECSAVCGVLILPIGEGANPNASGAAAAASSSRYFILIITNQNKADDVPALQKLEDQTSVPKEYTVVGGVVSLFFLIFFGIGAGVLCNVIGFLYPAFKSFQALENRVSSEVTQWLIYWVVFSFFSIIEVFVDVLLYWIPFYYSFKVAFLLWAMMPQTRGAKFLYDSFLKDFLKKNESKIDAALKDAKTSAGKVAVEASGAAKEVAATVASSLNKSNGDKKDE